jgi:hypothetical protein
MSDCFFVDTPKPKITLVYVYPLDGQGGFAPHALEFAQSYVRNPPGLHHDTLIICNGAPATGPSKALFDPLQNKTFIDHDNSGWDIGAFQLAARSANPEMMVFCGSHTYFRKPGWLARMHEIFCELGDTLYGATGNQGDDRFGVYAHVRTTGFWCTPSLMRAYPHKVTQGGAGGERYQAEHGVNCLTSWIIKQGKTPWIVAWDCVWPVQQCDQIPGGYHNGEQYNLLVGDRLTCPPYWGVP